MENFSNELFAISMALLMQDGKKPNYSDSDFRSAIIIFHTALMDKMWDLQESEKMSNEDRENMAQRCGEELRKLVKTYAGIDTHELV